MLMPEPDQQVIDRRDQICRTLRSIVPADCVIDSTESMRAFDADGLSAYRQLPLAVVLPETVAQIAAVMKWCHQNEIKIVPRGAGTSLSGGALPLADAVLLGLGKFNRILEIDYDNRCVVAQPGVTNLATTTPRTPHTKLFFLIHIYQLGVRRCAARGHQPCHNPCGAGRRFLLRT